jgi:hypothetical protein
MALVMEYCELGTATMVLRNEKLGLTWEDRTFPPLTHNPNLAYLQRSISPFASLALSFVLASLAQLS